MKQSSKQTPSVKQGAASIYMVVVCALLFSVITAGFVVLMVNENSKSGENDLSQSAYQSSLAGIEDTKTAIQKYYSCIGKTDADAECANVVSSMNNLMASAVCEGSIENLGKILYGNSFNYDGTNGMLIQENINNGENIVQAYTCVNMNLNPTDYLATLTQSSPQRLIPLNTAGQNKDVKYVKISWYSTSNLGQSTTQFSNINSNNQPIFKSADNDGIGIPPVLAVQLYQAKENFSVSDLNFSTGENVSPTSFESLNNRGVFWLIPSDLDSLPSSKNNNNFYTSYYEEYAIDSNILMQQAFIDSNNHSNSVIHEGFPIRCAKRESVTDDETSSTNGYLCSAFIEIPKIKTGSERSNKYGTFLLSLSLPYQQPDTDIKVEMYNNTSEDPIAYDQVQVVIDSTGRANDIYSRTESRVEFYDSSFPFPDYAMTLGNDGGTSLQKTFSVSGSESKCWSYNSGGDPDTVEDCTL